MKSSNVRTRKAGCCFGSDCDSKSCMVIPDDKTCVDCAHFDRCSKMFGVKATYGTCDFFPRKFVLKVMT